MPVFGPRPRELARPSKQARFRFHNWGLSELAAYSAMLAALHSPVNCLGSRGSSHNCKKLPAPRMRPRVLGSGTFGCGTPALGVTIIGETCVVVAVGISTAWA